AASCRKCSQLWMPGTAVAIGLNCPRISAGASDFMSNVSMWLAAPGKKTMTADFAFRGFCVEPPDLPGNVAASPGPGAAEGPARANPGRVSWKAPDEGWVMDVAREAGRWGGMVKSTIFGPPGQLATAANSGGC